MSDTAIATPVDTNPAVSKKPRSKRNALKQKNASTNEANIVAQKISVISPVTGPPSDSDPAKENLSQPLSLPKKSKGRVTKPKQAKQSFEKEMEEMQEMLQKLKIEKEKTEELLKEKDEILKAKEEELQLRGKEQEKLQMEVKKLQKLKEFKPNMSFPLAQPLNDQDKKLKKKGRQEIKRPSAPYILWCKEQWNEIKKQNPNAEFKEISNILGEKWKNVSAEEKKPYEEKYQAEKDAYLQVMNKEKREREAMKLLEEDQKQKIAMELLEQYLQFKQESEKDNTKTKKEKDPLKPKHPMSAFFVFAKERRSALLEDNKTVTEVAKITGEEWRNMTEEQKAPYEELAKQNKEKYAQEMEAYKVKKDAEEMNHKKEEEELLKLHKQEALQLLKKKEKTDNIIKKTKEKKQKKKQQQQNADPNKPKRPASSFIMFSKVARKCLMQERPGINNSTLNALISVKWKELSEEERQWWNGKAAEAMEVYKKEVEEYNKTMATTSSSAAV